MNDSILNAGTVCGPIDRGTADFICSTLNYGSSAQFGTAASKG